MPQTVLTGATLTAGIRSDFQDTYRQTYDGVLDDLATVMAMGIPSNKRTEIYGLRRTMPYPRLWLNGDPRPQAGTDSKQFSVTNFDYAVRVQWNRNDRMDNLVGDVMADAGAAGTHFASLNTRFQIELMTATADLLPAIPNAPDGAALYAATAEGSARFGVTGGNIFTGTGVATSPAIQADFFAAIAQQGAFLNTQSQPFFENETKQESYTVYYGVDNQEVFLQAFIAMIVSGGTPATAGGVSNVILASGAAVRLKATSRLNGLDDWFIFRDDAPVKATFVQDREALRAVSATEDNSDEARNAKVEYVDFTSRLGVGVNVPFATIKVNN